MTNATVIYLIDNQKDLIYSFLLILHRRYKHAGSDTEATGRYVGKYW